MSTLGADSDNTHTHKVMHAETCDSESSAASTLLWSVWREKLGFILLLWKVELLSTLELFFFLFFRDFVFMIF